jgi:hypothetical protein
MQQKLTDIAHCNIEPTPSPPDFDRARGASIAGLPYERISTEMV